MRFIKLRQAEHDHIIYVNIDSIVWYEAIDDKIYEGGPISYLRLADGRRLGVRNTVESITSMIRAWYDDRNIKR